MLEEYVYFRLLALAYFFYNKHTFRIVLALATYNTSIFCREIFE